MGSIGFVTSFEKLPEHLDSVVDQFPLLDQETDFSNYLLACLTRHTIVVQNEFLSHG